MNWDEIKGSWKEMRGRVREQWGKLTDDDVDIIAGRRDRLVGLIQQRYGTLKEDADAQVTAFERRLAEYCGVSRVVALNSWTNEQLRLKIGSTSAAPDCRSQCFSPSCSARRSLAEEAPHPRAIGAGVLCSVR
jgi:uncharacterized protein YjbJ (UPF0337 family)